MRENMTMLAMVLSALEDCRNGTTDSFQPLNISNQDAPEMVEQMLPMDHRSTMHNASHEKMHNASHEHHRNASDPRHNHTKLEGRGLEDAGNLKGRKRRTMDRSEEGKLLSGLAMVLLVAGFIGLAYGVI